MEKLTPMMKQYMKIKEKYKDCILFFRLGDFYEMFFEDAITASKVLEITLTGKSCGLEERAPMCGVPFHSSTTYISRLVENGYKVAICEQVEDPGQSKGIVKREVIRVISPGTVLDENLLDSKTNNYLMSIYLKDTYDVYGVSYVDITTGQLCASSVKASKLIEEIAKVSPKEIVYNSDIIKDKIDKIAILNNIYLSKKEDEFMYDMDNNIIYKYFTDEYIKSLNMSNEIYEALNLLLNYIFSTQMQITSNINVINIYDPSEYMDLDMFTRVNLELTQTMRNKQKKGSLLYVLDQTCTNMGGRLLRKWIDEPLINKCKIQNRLNLIDEIKNDYNLSEDLKFNLKDIYDIERLCGKIAFEKINPKELISLKKSIAHIPTLKQTILESNATKLKEFVVDIDELDDIYTLIDTAILECANMTLKEGNIIKSEFNEEVANLRDISTNGANIINNIQLKEREKTGIKNLKVSYNKVFGYFIEITSANLKNFTPANEYIRKQTLSNCERFITEELKSIEEKILNAQDKIKDLEYNIFVDIRNTLYKNISRIQKVSNLIAKIDAIYALSSVANKNNYTKPDINTDGILEIKNGRHPVIETIIGENNFICNNTNLDLEKENIGIITGPNMAGKSTYMRQVSLITLLAHIGSFVPASYANIPLTDRIFTRVGASDDLSQGQSTFMVEMSEVSNILKNATQNSLVILDEVGRGTSTYDGLSLAWSIIEYISYEIGCKTLFATHYHELTQLEDKIHTVKNYSVAVSEEDGNVIFLRKIINGGADKSYGIHVAKLADIPEKVITRADEILKELESDKKNYNLINTDTKSMPSCEIAVTDIKQLSFENVDSANDKALKQDSISKKVSILKEISSLNIANMTPLDALNELYKIQTTLNGDGLID